MFDLDSNWHGSQGCQVCIADCVGYGKIGMSTLAPKLNMQLGVRCNYLPQKGVQAWEGQIITAVGG